jgi:phospholipase/carboxylesterase
MKNFMLGSLNSYEIAPHNQTPKSCVIFLHGYGANWQDLIGIGQEWQSALPDTVFISPDAPEPCEMGGGGRQWFSLSEYSLPAMEREITKPWPALEGYINAVAQHYTLNFDQIILCGFSQGTMMSLYALPRMQKALGGVLGYSGRLIGERAFEKKTNVRTPIYLAHGEADPVVHIDSWHHASTILKANEYEIDGHTTPGLPHGIDTLGIEKGLIFIQKILSE